MPRPRSPRRRHRHTSRQCRSWDSQARWRISPRRAPGRACGRFRPCARCRSRTRASRCRKAFCRNASRTSHRIATQGLYPILPSMPDSTARPTPPGPGGPALDGEPPSPNAAMAADVVSNGGLLRFILRRLRRREKNEAVREAIEELIEETPESDTPISDDQRVLLANILKLRDKTVADVMVPRVDIIGISADTPLDEVVRLIQGEAHSRYPVYREALDDVIGMVHIKDVLAYWGTAKKFNLRDILRRVVFVAPTLPVLDMLLDMRRSRTHMALVVDEFGGTDGLLTIEDLVAEIVGAIEDEHDVAQAPVLARRVDGTIDVNGRPPVEMLEQEIGSVLSEDERREIDTVGGLIFSLLVRIPERGELVQHPSGVEFEILDVDPRRIRRLRVRPPAAEQSAA